MKHAVALIALAAAAVAAPSEQAKRTCPAGWYGCTSDGKTMQICDTDGSWKRLEPGCPNGTACREDPFGNRLPYCVVPTAKKAKRNCTTGQMFCEGDGAIGICVGGMAQKLGDCPDGSTCQYLGEGQNRSPFCI